LRYNPQKNGRTTYIRPVLSCLFVLFSYALATGPAAAKDIDEPFKYEFFASDIFKWIDGTRQGPVTDSKGHMATSLRNEMLAAERYVDMAVYGVRKQQWVFNTLEDLVSRRVRVRAVVDQMCGDLNVWDPKCFAYRDTVELAKILEPGNLTPDLGPDGTPRSGSIMHNKFVVIDRKKVWLGTTNLSHTGVGSEYNANTSIMVESPELAIIFANEFYQMHSLKRFSRYKKKPSRGREPLNYSDGTKVSVYFSPQSDAVVDSVLPFINKTKRRISIGMFYLTDDRVARALVAAKNRGVDVRVIYDALAAAHPSTMHHYLRNHGVEVRVENWGGKMHMKTAVSDSQHLLIGSMNWSLAGSRNNDESTVVIENNRGLARKFTIYFNKLWASLEASQNGPEFNDPRAESRKSINSCSDGLDNDHDGLKDDMDPGCAP